MTKGEVIEILGDYLVAIGGSVWLWMAWRGGGVTTRLFRAFLYGMMLFAPIEYIQPRIGWVFYYKCDTYAWAPLIWMWVIHAMWDAMILVGLLGLVRCVYGPRAWSCYLGEAALLMSVVGMLQEILIESTETLWYYVPTRWNPTWAVINGRNMTLQQWHWSVLPVVLYRGFVEGI